MSKSQTGAAISGSGIADNVLFLDDIPEDKKVPGGDNNTFVNYRRVKDRYINDDDKNDALSPEELIKLVSKNVLEKHGDLNINGEEVSYKEMIERLQKSAEIIKHSKLAGLNKTGVTNGSESYTTTAPDNANKTKELGA